MSTILIGAGGHAKVVFEALIFAGSDPTQVTVRADHEGEFMGRLVQAPECLADMRGMKSHVAIGNNAVRIRLLDRARASGSELLSVVHPDASLSPSATIGQGTFVACRAIVSSQARVGHGVIINHGAIVDHDCVIGDGTHIAPASTLGGAVLIGKNVLVGSNATILPGIEIGNDVVIGAGSVVTKSIPHGAVWIGNARIVRE
ncbi:acetyltransferase [Rhizobium sp. CAU 1783]